MLSPKEQMRKLFPKLTFDLNEIQEEAVSSVIANKNTLCIMPTGGGKSLVYWLSAAILGGTTIVISPLIALITEQSELLRSHGYETLELHSSISAQKQFETLTRFANKEITPDFIFVSPEKIAVDGYFEFCCRKRKDEIKLFVIDEVHCVSQWGISFRPFYKRIPCFLNNVYNNEWTRILAITATLNPLELKEICDAFRIDSKNIVKNDILMRNEIQLHIKKLYNEKEKEEYFWKLIERHKDEKTIVYLYRKKGDRGVEGLYSTALSQGYKADYFHGDLDAKERMNIISKFRSGETNIIFATNAFGMGIDINDIRVVIHFMIPESVEQYYQEIGRAARDRNGANAYLLYTNKNIDIKRSHFINRSFPSSEKLLETFKKIAKKTGYRPLQIYDDDDIQDCLQYYIDSGLIEIACKGFSGLEDAVDIKDNYIKALYESTSSKSFVKTATKNNLDVKYFADLVYEALVLKNVKFTKTLQRYIILKINKDIIDDNTMNNILDMIEQKKAYKHDLLNYFVYLLEQKLDSAQLHQEIALYLGMNKFHTNRIYKTVDGNNVRSKSEVIICNLLATSGIPYKYEEDLIYEGSKRISPDFTIYLPDGTKLFWEHVGMLGNDEYNTNWEKKLKIYDEHFPKQLIKTYETGAISSDANNLICAIKNKYFNIT